VSFLFSSHPPKVIRPRVMPEIGQFRLLDFHPEEIARQLTLLDAELYRSIKPWEFLGLSWAKKDKDKRAPRIIAMINHFNLISNRIAAELLQVETLRERIALLKHIIEIAGKCLSLNNYNATMEVVSGLGASAVFRLKHTWAGIGSKHLKILNQCREVTSRHQNYKNFREHLHSVNPPVVPYLGVYLTDLTFLEDGNSDTLPESGMINFVKRRLVSQVIREIQQYQDTPYALEPFPELQQWLVKPFVVQSEEEAHDVSLRLEPKDGSLPSAVKTRKIGKSKSLLGPPPDAQPYGEMEDILGYPFSDPDSRYNIITAETRGKTSILEATVTKLIERLTFATYPGKGTSHSLSRNQGIIF
jgi:son of sevenless